MRVGFTREPRRVVTVRRRIAAVFMIFAVGFLTALSATGPAAAAPDVQPGDSVYLGEQIYVAGSAIMFPVWKTEPADLDNPGTPDYWAYGIEQAVSPEHSSDPSSSAPTSPP